MLNLQLHRYHLTFGLNNSNMYKVFYYIAIFQLIFVFNASFGQTSSNWERIYLHTDRDIYIAGEELFFKCYRYNSSTEKQLVASRYVYLVLRNERNLHIHNICFKLVDDMFSGSIYLPDTLSTGRYQLVSYTNYMRNLGEDIYFTKEILIANRFDKDLIGIYAKIPYDTLVSFNYQVLKDKDKYLNATPERKEYSKLEKIRVNLEAIGLKNNEFAHVSVSVHEKTFQQDNMLRTKSSNLTTGSLSCRYLPEIKDVLLEGRVINEESKQVTPNISVFLSLPDTIANLQFTRTNRDGIFRFLLNNYYYDKNLILSLPDYTKGHIELDNKYDLKEPFNPSRVFSDSLLKDYLHKSQNIVQIQKAFKFDNKQVLVDTNYVHDIPPLAYPPVSNSVYPGDFASLPDFIEISREILPMLKIRKNETAYETRVFNLNDSKFFDQDPLIFLDGVPINSINQILSLGTEKIYKIETITAERYDRGLFFSGVLAVFSKKMEINNIILSTSTLFNKYIELQPQSTFKVADLSKFNVAPDFRQLLYWEPSINLASNEKKYIEFTASDNKGEFEVAIEGITSDGNFINVKSSFKIGSKSSNK